MTTFYLGGSVRGVCEWVAEHATDAATFELVSFVLRGKPNGLKTVRFDIGEAYARVSFASDTDAVRFKLTWADELLDGPPT